MRIIVSSSRLIDLRKASLLDPFLRLLYEILLPNTLFEEELLKFTAEQKKTLMRAGLQVVDLSLYRVLRAQEVMRNSAALRSECVRKSGVSHWKSCGMRWTQILSSRENAENPKHLGRA